MNRDRGPEAAVGRAATWAGVRLGEEQWGKLGTYAAWLVDEAIPAGGLGPREANRVWSRHIADSVVFARAWGENGAAELVDVGSGAGLPGIPLAIVWPQCRVTLLDRSGRRVRLLRRIVRILALSRVAVVQGDAFAVDQEWEGMVFRGAVTASEAVGLTGRLLADDGISVVGLSRRPTLPEGSEALVGVARALGVDGEVVKVPDQVLDGPSWLLIMTRRAADA